MKMTSIIAALILTASITACSSVKKVVYRIDVPQGNYLEQEKVDQVKVGMNQEQVAYLLGTPLLQDVFSTNRWGYVFIKRKGHEDPIQQTVFVYFDSRGLVNDIKFGSAG